MIHTTRKQRKTFDLGSTLVDVDVELAKKTDMIVVTFYVNGTSLRSHNMNLQSVLIRAIEAMWVLSGAEEIAQLTEEISSWVHNAVSSYGDHS